MVDENYLKQKLFTRYMSSSKKSYPIEHFKMWVEFDFFLIGITAVGIIYSYFVGMSIFILNFFKLI